MFKKFVVVLVIILIGLSLSAQDKNILLIESYHTEYSWDNDYITALKAELAGIANIDIFQMDTKRVPKDQYQKKADEAWNKYQNGNYDLVILGDDNAMKFLAPKFENESIPVVFLGINDNPRNYFDNHAIPANFTGVLERPLMKRNIANLKEIKPDLKNVLVLFDDGNTSAIVKKENFYNKNTIDIAGINVDIELIGNFKVWKERVEKAVDDYDIIIVGLYHTLTENGKHVDANDVLKYTNQNSKVEIFAFWEFAVGKDKTIGGLVLSGKVQGKAAADLVLKILNTGKIPDVSIPERGKLIFSKSLLAKWNITLPEEISTKAEFIE